MTSASNWAPYYDKTRGRAPRPLLVEAVTYVTKRGQALELGAGALSDSRFLLEQGYEVTAVDSSELMVQEAATIYSEGFRAVLSTFADFAYPVETYDLISAMHSLPFNPHQSFDAVFAQIIAALASGGVFCGTLFGDRDSWTEIPEMTFHTRANAEARFDGLEIIKFEESEEDSTSTVGVPKHWHVFEFIVRKPKK